MRQAAAVSQPKPLLDVDEGVVPWQCGHRASAPTEKDTPSTSIRSRVTPVAEGDILAFFGCTAGSHVHRPSAPPSQLAHLSGASLVVAPNIDANGNFLHRHADSVYLGLQDAPAQATINRDGNLLRTAVPSNTCHDGAALPGCLILRLETACRTRRCSAESDVLTTTLVQTLLQAAAVRSPGMVDVTAILTGVLPRRLDAHAVSSLHVAACAQPHATKLTETEREWAHAHEHTTGSEFGRSVASGCMCESRTSSADTLLNRNSSSSFNPDSPVKYISAHNNTVEGNKISAGEKQTAEFWHQNSVPAFCHNRGWDAAEVHFAECAGAIPSPPNLKIVVT